MMTSGMHLFVLMICTAVQCVLSLPLEAAFVATTAAAATAATAATADDDDDDDDDDTNDYGMDVSFPMTKDRIESPNILGDRQGFYDEILQGCSRAYDRDLCRLSEQRRIERNKRRPAILNNFTQNGFVKIKTPIKLWSLVEQFWIDNSAREHWSVESWEYGESTVNHWDAPTYFVSLYNSTLQGGGSDLESAIWNSAKATLEEWTQQTLRGCSLYGIRIYTEGSILHTHVDRVPLIASAILNVAQDTDEPWPLEVIGHDGKAHNISMVPGDMILYESHTILHGRPFPLKGRYMANIFVHFEVIDQNGGDVLPYVNYDRVTAQDYQQILKEHGEHWNRRSVVSTLIHTLAGNGNTEEVRQLLQQDPRLVSAEDPQCWTPLHEAARGPHIETIQLLLNEGADINAITIHGATPTFVAEQYQGADSLVAMFLQSKGGIAKEAVEVPPTLPHQLAGDGELSDLQFLVEKNPRIIHAPDDNGWTPLHEAARGGHIEVVQYLLSKGAKLNQPTKGGGTPLYYAAKFQGDGSIVYQFLKEVGGVQLGPEL